MDLGEIHAQHAIKRGPDLEVRGIHLSSFGSDLGKVADVLPPADLQCLERDLQLAIALKNLDLVKVVQRQRLAERCARPASSLTEQRRFSRRTHDIGCRAFPPA